MTNPIIIALDVPSAADARAVVAALGEAQSFYKVGMELYAAAGMEFVRELAGAGKDVFLDMKYYDIPETVKRATAQVAASGVRLLTVHASAAVVRAAKEGAAGSGLKILAVTVLTAFDQNDLRDLGYTCTPAELVDHLTRAAGAAGADGFVCSPLEVARVRELAGPQAILVTPGVRSAGAAAGDQKRVATPAEAIRNGATYLVIGRQVRRAADPKAALDQVLLEVNRQDFQPSLFH